MGNEDYYSILELASDCTDAEIKKAYRQLATKWHPDANENSNKALVAQKFRSIAEAYTVLSDGKLRTIYDQYGLQGLQNGIPNGKGGYVGAWSYNQNPEEQFTDFVGRVSHFASYFAGDSGFMPIFPDTKVAKAGKVAAQTINLYCSLEELYQGCMKKVKVNRQRLSLDGKTTTPEDKVMTVDVQAGWREGTKITFTEEGDEAAQMSTGDIIFVLKEMPHPRFSRSKNDLIYTAAIDLTAALVGTVVEVLTLDRRTIPIAINEIVKPNTPKVVPGEGMPLVGKSTKGNLIIQFDVQFPEMLTEDQKSKIKEILS
jgi:DnaJ-class molecular chaperone